VSFFGHEKGAFTGATERRKGRFELAHNGTILLDEISEIPSKLQAKLLRVLQEKEFERVGGNRTMSVDVRVLATTNRNLAQAIERGEFRQDLFYRLNVFPLLVPTLRDRKEDIIPLAEAFLKQSCRSVGVKLLGISSEAKQQLLAHNWPGNIRELQNTIERSVILSEDGKSIQANVLGLTDAPISLLPSPQSSEQDTLSSQDVPDKSVQASPGSVDTAASEAALSSKTLEEIEKEHILRVLADNNGNRKATADILKVSIRTLRNKLNLYKE